MKDTLVIIGNGFDIWQGIGTSYADFKNYYLKNRDAIKKRLHIKDSEYPIYNSEWEPIGTRALGDVELVYGDPFSHEELDDAFWGDVETSLGGIDSFALNLYFGKSRKGLKSLRKSLRRAKKIMNRAFRDWVASKEITETDPVFNFGENCLFVNFNYTNTLERRFGIDKRDVLHIHGKAADEDSIVFGHSCHPQYAEPVLAKMGGRFRGLYLVENLLYETDKHVWDNIFDLQIFLSLHGVSAQDIKHIYVLGHSMGLVDMAYFLYLIDATRVKSSESHNSKHGFDADTAKGLAQLDDSDPLEELNNRIQYSIKCYGADPTLDNTITEEEYLSTQRRFRIEQAERDARKEKLFLNRLEKATKRSKKNNWARAHDSKHSNPTVQNTLSIDKLSPETSSAMPLQAEKKTTREADALWHISCFSEQDHKQVETVMDLAEFENYRLYKTIDECLDAIGKKDSAPNRQAR